jgi:hypothetical protein
MLAQVLLIKVAQVVAAPMAQVVMLHQELAVMVD